MPFADQLLFLHHRTSAIKNTREQVNLNEVNIETELTAYPNPFKSVATVRLSSLNSEEVTLDIFDPEGKRVKQLYKGKVEANVSKKLPLSSAGLAPGLYTLRLTTKNRVVSKKIVLVK